MRIYRKSFTLFLVILVLPVLFMACSTKKNTPMSRQWQAFNTRYNVYFNGKLSGRLHAHHAHSSRRGSR